MPRLTQVVPLGDVALNNVSQQLLQDQRSPFAEI